jgi:serine/threonine protein kinase
MSRKSSRFSKSVGYNSGGDVVMRSRGEETKTKSKSKSKSKSKDEEMRSKSRSKYEDGVIGGVIGGFVGAGNNGAIYKYRTSIEKKVILKIQKMKIGRPELEAGLMRKMHEILPLNFHDVLKLYTFPGLQYDKPKRKKYGVLCRGPNTEYTVSGVVVPRARMDWYDFEFDLEHPKKQTKQIDTSIFKQVFISILAMNAAGLYHNDIKKDNVLIDILPEKKNIKYVIQYKETNVVVTFETANIATISDFGLVSDEFAGNELEKKEFKEIVIKKGHKLKVDDLIPNDEWTNCVSDMHRFWWSLQLTNDDRYHDICAQMLNWFWGHWVVLTNKLAHGEKITTDDMEKELDIGMFFITRYFIKDDGLEYDTKPIKLDFKPHTPTKYSAQPAYMCGIKRNGESLSGTRIFLSECPERSEIEPCVERIIYKRRGVGPRITVMPSISRPIGTIKRSRDSYEKSHKKLRLRLRL